MTDSAIAINGGCFRPIELRLPEGSIVNPRVPAPVNSRTSTIKRIAGSIIGALLVYRALSTFLIRRATSSRPMGLSNSSAPSSRQRGA